MYDHQLNYWISKHFQMGLVIKGLTLATVMDFGVLTSTKISAAVVSLLTSSLLLMLWFWRRGVNLPSWSSHLRVWDNLSQSWWEKSEKYQQSLRETNEITLLQHVINLFEVSSRLYDPARYSSFERTKQFEQNNKNL